MGASFGSCPRRTRRPCSATRRRATSSRVNGSSTGSPLCGEACRGYRRCDLIVASTGAKEKWRRCHHRIVTRQGCRSLYLAGVSRSLPGTILAPFPPLPGGDRTIERSAPPAPVPLWPLVRSHHDADHLVLSDLEHSGPDSAGHGSFPGKALARPSPCCHPLLVSRPPRLPLPSPSPVHRIRNGNRSREKHKEDVYMVVQHPGETIFVPAFWMHAVLNLDDTVAVTQNFVSRHNFPNVSAKRTREVLGVSVPARGHRHSVGRASRPTLPPWRIFTSDHDMCGARRTPGPGLTRVRSAGKAGRAPISCLSCRGSRVAWSQ